MNAIIAMNRKMADQNKPKEIDWEQRRYEIALALFTGPSRLTAQKSVINADNLIAELKKGGEK